MPIEQLEMAAKANAAFKEAEEAKPPRCQFDNSALIWIENSLGSAWWCPTCKTVQGE